MKEYGENISNIDIDRCAIYKILLILGKIYEEVCKKKFSSWSLREEVIYRDGTPGKTSKPVIHLCVDLKNPNKSQIKQSDLKEAARVCGFTTDPYTSPIIYPSVVLIEPGLRASQNAVIPEISNYDEPPAYEDVMKNKEQ